VEALARFGLACRGVMYILIAWIATRISSGQGGEADRQGALMGLAVRPWTRPTLIALAVGFAGYAAWRLVQAFFDPEREATGDKKWVKRVAYAARGMFYLYLSWSSLHMAITVSSKGSSNQQAQRATSKLLTIPMGRWWVAAVGIAFLSAAGYNAYRVITAKYRKEMKERKMTPNERRWLTVMASIGLTARTVTFTLIGIFFLIAAKDADPNRSVGLDGALNKIASAPGGRLGLSLIAVGLAAFGVFSIMQAKYRKVLDH